MKHPFNKQRLWLLVSLLCLTIVAGSGLLWHSAQPSPPVSDTYLRYSHVEGIEASYIRNFPVNDTLSIPVTTFKATTDSAWALLQNDFKIKTPSSLIMDEIKKGNNIISVRLISKKDITQMDTADGANDVMAYSFLNHIISIFHTHNQSEINSINNYNWQKSIKNR
jgi:hypothetical protein